AESPVLVSEETEERRDGVGSTERPERVRGGHASGRRAVAEGLDERRHGGAPGALREEAGGVGRDGRVVVGEGRAELVGRVVLDEPVVREPSATASGRVPRRE